MQIQLKIKLFVAYNSVSADIITYCCRSHIAGLVLKWLKMPALEFSQVGAVKSLIFELGLVDIVGIR